MLFAGDHGAAFLGGLQHDFLVQRLDGAQVDDTGLDALVFQLFGGDEGLVHFQAGGNDSHIVALGELFALADFELEGGFVMEYRQS